MPLLFQRLKPKNRSEKRIFFMDATVKLWWICLVYLAVVTFFFFCSTEEQTYLRSKDQRAPYCICNYCYKGKMNLQRTLSSLKH